MSYFELITSQPQLVAFCSNAITQAQLYLDTEFVRTRTFRPKLGLIQAYDGHNIVLIDPLADIDLTPFWALLGNPNITKVLHSCSEDLEVFKCFADFQPSPLFDTQVAAAFLAEGNSLGYAPLVEKLLGIHVDKGESRTDWLARPLSERQLDYAAKDVLYLKDLYQKLSERLIAKGLYSFVITEGELAVAKRNIDKSAAEVYFDVKGAWQLDGTALAVLKNLASWRYQEAQRRDLALNFVVKEVNLITIAKYQPRNLQQLRQLPGILPQEVRYHGDVILQHVQQACELSQEQQPPRIKRLIDYPGYKKCYKQIREEVEQAAAKVNIPVEAVASKRQINQVVSWLFDRHAQLQQNRQKPDLLQGWRAEIVGDHLQRILSQPLVV